MPKSVSSISILTEEGKEVQEEGQDRGRPCRGGSRGPSRRGPKEEANWQRLRPLQPGPDPGVQGGNLSLIFPSQPVLDSILEKI